MKKLILILLFVLGLILLRTCFYTVDVTEYAYVTRLGKHVATYDGADNEEAGLHFGWPWPLESVVKVKRTLHHFVLPAVEQITKDSKLEGTIDQTVTIDGYVCWRIPNKDAVDRFIRSVGTVERAEKILLDRIRGDLGAVIPTKSLDQLVNAEKGVVESERKKLRESLLAPHHQKDGIEVVDIRIRRLNHPPEVRYSKLQRIISEREKKAASYRAEGLQEAAKIRSASDAKIRELEARVQAELEEKRGAAEAEAERILNEAQSKDPEYYAELKKRAIALNALKSKTKIYSTSLWELLFPEAAGKKKDK